jgi:histidyl-tRNA synthetase
MKPSIPRGTRDFGPVEMQKRNYILSIIRRNFELFGYACIETPAMENITTLTGKYGDEGDQLIFKILNSRIHENKDKEILKKEFDLSLQSSRNSEILTEKALRYDLTVPFARFVTMNQHQLTFPFKRYQVQAVWRADRPQKGRYREFYQCDADVIGSKSLLNELELIALIDKNFKELHIPVVLKFNNRKILTALSELINEPSKIIEITVAIDKLDKVGKEGVIKELREKEISEKAIETLQPLLDFKGNNQEKLSVLTKLLGQNATGKKGIEEISFLLEEVSKMKTDHMLFELDITLARGLNYYTGTIFEVKASSGSLSSSILGGGRYDDLTGIFGLADMSGVGISFGIDRIYDVMEELNLFPAEVLKSTGTKLLFTHFDTVTQLFCLQLANDLRTNDIACEVYPDVTKKLSKQFDFANKKNIPFVCTIGSDEMETGVFSLKNMETGVQQKLNHKDLIEYIKLNT